MSGEKIATAEHALNKVGVCRRLHGEELARQQDHDAAYGARKRAVAQVGTGVNMGRAIEVIGVYMYPACSLCNIMLGGRCTSAIAHAPLPGGRRCGSSLGAE